MNERIGDRSSPGDDLSLNWHNAAMVERFISMSGKHADMRFNNTDFKEPLFYGVLEPQDDFYKTNELLNLIFS